MINVAAPAPRPIYFYQVLDIMLRGYKSRTTFATNMNEHSSRSHAMLNIYVKGTNSTTGLSSTGKLHLVDLAG
jgi:kinesin family protein C2/C3